MEQEPPPITVVNPSRTTDELVAEGPRRRWVLGLVLLVVLAAGIVISTVRDDRSADRAAADGLLLSVDVAPDTRSMPAIENLVPVAVHNEGSDAVRVLSARLEGPGYARIPFDLRIAPGSLGVLTLPDTATCSPAMADDPASALELRVRTSRGTTVTRSVGLSPEAFRAVTLAARRRCGYLPADEAFQLATLSSSLEQGTAVITVRVGNGSRYSMQLSQLLPMPGLSLTTTPALPLDLPAQTTSTSPVRSLPLRVTLTVKDCGTFLHSVQRTAGRRSALVRGWLVQQGATGFEVPVLTFDPASSHRPAVDPSAIATQLLQGC